MKRATPTRILSLRDAFTAHPERLRKRANEPQPIGPVGPPPRSLNPAQRLCFRELVKRACPGVLGASDAIVVELAARLLEEVRRDPGVSAAKLRTLQSLLGTMGMSPSDRVRVEAARPRGDGPGSFDF